MIDRHRREYLISRIKKNTIVGDNGCIEWIATKNNQGYGLVHFAIQFGDGHKSSIPAHRAHYMAYYNIILQRNQFVCHKCDNPACVNIEHLFVGTPKDNMQDKLAKDRNAKKYKLHTRKRVISNEIILGIKSDTRPLRDVSHHYGVSMSYVSKLRNGKAKTLVK